LIVEAEPAETQLCRMVRGLGYDVVNVADARGALELLRQFPRHMRLLLSDVLMPGMDGGELAERARALRPDLQVVLLAAGLTDEMPLLAAYPELPILMQPVRFPSLYRLLRHLLGPPASLHIRYERRSMPPRRRSRRIPS
jgi:CheY-like chemotaxis protein